MQRELINYVCEEIPMRAYVSYPTARQGRLPSVFVTPTWRGLDPFSREKADELASLGYLAFVIDLYGHGQRAESDTHAASLMNPLFEDRRLLRARMLAAFETLKKHSLADENKIAAVGYCFGGLACLELLKSGANIKGVVSVHGLLGNALGDLKAKTLPFAEGIRGSALLLHGHEDPLVSSQDIALIQKELTQAKVDWQMHIYGHAAHAFTNPEAREKALGLAFEPKANRRSWQVMCAFLAELFS